MKITSLCGGAKLNKVLINNTTENSITVLTSNTSHIINAKSDKFVELENEDTIVIKKNKPYSHLCIGRYYLKDTIRSGWIFMPIVILNFDSVVKINKSMKSIDITEKRLCFLFFTIFSLLFVNMKPADSYRFSCKNDVRKFMFCALLFLLPLLLICLVLLLGCIGATIVEFSSEIILVLIWCLGANLLLISIAKDINQFKKINLPKVLSKSKPVSISLERKWLIVYKTLR